MNPLMNVVHNLMASPEYLALLILVFITVSMTIMGTYILVSRKSIFKARLNRFMPGEKGKQHHCWQDPKSHGSFAWRTHRLQEKGQQQLHL